MALDHGSLPMDVIGAAVSAAGFDLEDVSVRPAGRQQHVRVVIDGDDGVDLDAAAAVSRALSAALDESGDAVLGGASYTLEVTSPGIGSPLSVPRHFRRAARRRIAVVGTDGSLRSVRMIRVVDGGILVLADGNPPVPVTIPFAEIARATVEVEFSPPSAQVAELVEQLMDDCDDGAVPQHDEEGDGAR